MIKTNYNPYNSSGFSPSLYKSLGYSGSKLLITLIKKGNNISIAMAIFSGRLAKAYN